MTSLKSGKSEILKDPRWLLPLSEPSGGEPIGRLLDLETLEFYFSEVFSAGQGVNLFVCGNPGTGKTLCVKHILNHICKHAQEYDIPVATVYVNAGKTITPYFTLLELVKGLGQQVASKGFQMYRLKQAFESVLKEKAVVACIDDVQSLSRKRESLIHYLNREQANLILVSNKLNYVTSLEEHELSTLQLRVIEFAPYSLAEAYDILRDRAEKAFYPNVMSRKFLKEAANHASEAGDIRLGFAILLNAGLLAQKQGKPKVEQEDLDSAIRHATLVKAIGEVGKLQKKLEKLGQSASQTLFDL